MQIFNAFCQVKTGQNILSLFNIVDIPLFCGLCRLQYTVKIVLFSSGAFYEIFYFEILPCFKNTV